MQVDRWDYMRAWLDAPIVIGKIGKERRELSAKTVERYRQLAEQQIYPSLGKIRLQKLKLTQSRIGTARSCRAEAKTEGPWRPEPQVTHTGSSEERCSAAWRPRCLRAMSLP